MVQDTLLDLSFIIILLILGVLVARILLQSRKTSEIGYLAFPLGAGIFSWILFLASWLGVPIILTTVLGVGFILVASTAALFLWTKKSDSEQNGIGGGSHTKSQLQKLAPAFLLAGLLATSMILSVGRSYSAWDAIAIWSIKGYGIAREGTIFAGAQWGAHGLSYPQNIPLLIASFKLLGGDLLPGSKLIFPLFYASLIAGCYQFWRHFKIPSSIAGLGALFVASIPVVFEHSTIGYVNLPFATYIALGCFLAIMGISDQDSKKQAISGILFGFACWTRPEGIFLVPIIVIALLIAFKISSLQPVRIIYWLLPILIIGGTWFVFLNQHSGPSHLSAGVQHLLQSTIQGQLPWEVLPKILRTLLRHAITLDTWGFVFPAAVVLVILNCRKLHPKRYPELFTLLAPMFVTAVAMIFFYVLGSFDADLDFMMSTGLDRMFLPFIVLTAAWTILLVGIPVSISAKRTS